MAIISSTVTRPSTTLLIAEKFMSSDYNADENTTITAKDDSSNGNSALMVTPQNHNDQVSVTPPFFLQVQGTPNQEKKPLSEQNQHRHAINNKIDVDPVVPEEDSDQSTFGGCCFVHCGETNLPTTHKQWGRRAWVMTTFLTVIMIAVVGFFFWPQIPLMRIEGAINTLPTKVTQTQQGGGRISHVAFESTWLLNITMDNRRNVFTTRFNRIQIIAKDAMTGLLIGKGLNNNIEAAVIHLPGKEISTIQLPISVNYQARDTTDTTFSNLIRACNNNSTESSHHSLPIHFWFTLYIFGLDWLGYRPTLIATPATGGFFCPFSS